MLANFQSRQAKSRLDRSGTERQDEMIHPCPPQYSRMIELLILVFLTFMYKIAAKIDC